MTTAAMPQPEFCTVDGLRTRYADSGSSRRRSILLTSPWPESLCCFARIWPALAEQARVFAVELPGFGASESRPDVLSPRGMGAFLARLIVDANLGAPHIVASGAGTPAALFAAAQHPDRVAGLIVDPGTSIVAPERGAGFDWLGYVGRYRDELSALVELIPQLRQPVTVVHGRRDRDAPLTHGLHLNNLLQDGRVVVVNAGHFPWTEAPLEYAALIVDSIRAAATVTAAA